MSDHKPRPFLMGVETEYAVSGQRGGQWVDPEQVFNHLAAAVRELRATVPDHSGSRGAYLQHGGRLYLDYGSHPEHATPECHTPRQAALYDKAGEHLLRLAAEVAMSKDPSLTVRVIKNNLDPLDPDSTTYGTHESYTSWVRSDEVGPQLIPHLVSRVLYCGSGGLTGRAGNGFELSQRARHLHSVEGDDTTSDRAIFSTRVRKMTDGGGDWTRIHLIGKDSQRAPFGIYLTHAVTGLLIEMINRGSRVGGGLELDDPVNALRAFSFDPWGKAAARLADGRRLRAVEIQAVYLEQCEKALQAGGLPEWAGEAIGHWRDTLAAVERNPMELADRLDAYCKLLIYENELLRAGLDWGELAAASRTLSTLQDYFGDAVTLAVLEDSPAGLDDEERPRFAEAIEMAQMNRPKVREQARFATRLRALDVKYHELGGLYDRLHDTGKLRDVVFTPLDVEQATRTPPPGGRAALRGAWIARHREDDWRGDWHFVWRGSTGQCIDLRDPFSGVERVVRLKLPENGRPYEVDVMTLLQSAAAVSA
jgi:proteasome accessory factor A